jgi:hypothetical protein
VGSQGLRGAGFLPGIKKEDYIQTLNLKPTKNNKVPQYKIRLKNGKETPPLSSPTDFITVETLTLRLQSELYTQ